MPILLDWPVNKDQRLVKAALAEYEASLAPAELSPSLQKLLAEADAAEAREAPESP